jgi:tRNA threonylcarbamoyladenosine biosynthesis protein TsaB
LALILNIETATKVCSVALAKNGKVISFKEEGGTFSHAEKLTLFIQDIFEEAKLKLSDIDAVCISKGPGSYTGLRIGVSTAKGLCFSLDKPLLSINSLQSLAWGAKQQIKKDALYCPMIDARRMEIFSAFYDLQNNEVRKTQADIINPESYRNYLQQPLYFFGDGAEKCKEIFANNSNAKFIDLTCSATYMAELAEQKFNKQQFEDIAYFEPFYLKDFVATTPKKLL